MKLSLGYDPTLDFMPNYWVPFALSNSKWEKNAVSRFLFLFIRPTQRKERRKGEREREREEGKERRKKKENERKEERRTTRFGVFPVCG